MLKQYVDLKGFLPKLEMDEIDDLILTTSEVRKMDAPCIKFEHLDSEAFQTANVNLAARAFFHTVIEEYSETCDSLGESAVIVQSAGLESEIIKVLDVIFLV